MRIGLVRPVRQASGQQVMALSKPKRRSEVGREGLGLVKDRGRRFFYQLKRAAGRPSETNPRGASQARFRIDNKDSLQ
jgi:hypothetical protein